LETALEIVPWQASQLQRRCIKNPSVTVSAIYDSATGSDLRNDTPVTFEPSGRAYTSRRVAQAMITLSSGVDSFTDNSVNTCHDPFELLGS
jgi:hypothetical protein